MGRSVEAGGEISRDIRGLQRLKISLHHQHSFSSSSSSSSASHISRVRTPDQAKLPVVAPTQSAFASPSPAKLASHEPTNPSQPSLHQVSRANTSSSRAPNTAPRFTSPKSPQTSSLASHPRARHRVHPKFKVQTQTLLSGCGSLSGFGPWARLGRFGFLLGLGFGGAGVRWVDDCGRGTAG